MTEKEITAVKAAIALDNLWYFASLMPAPAPAVDGLFVGMVIITDYGTFMVKNRKKRRKGMSLSPRGVSDRVSDTQKGPLVTL